MHRLHPPQLVLQFPHYVQFSTLPLTTRYTTVSTFHVAFPTTISSLLLNTQIQHLAQLPPQFVLNFPLPLCSIFDTAIDNEIHNCFYNSCFAFPIELHYNWLVDNDTPACTTHQNIFHHHQLLNLQVVLSSLLQPANTAPSTFRVAFPTAINQQAQLL